MKIHQDVHRLHQQYGDYVRVGPMEVSIIDPGALNPLYGNSSETAKGPWYILMEPLDGLVFTRDRKEHALRRKIVDQSLSSKALVTYEPVIAKCTEQLLQIIEDRSGNPINITEWLKRYSFEIMGHLIFGRPFNTISEEGGDTFLLDSIHSDTNMMGYLRHMPWIPALLIKTPLFRKKNTRFWTWLQTNFRQRTEKGSPNPDIFSLLLSAHGKGPKTRLDTYKLCGLGYSILLAGSDTTFSVATNVFFNLARDRALTHKLQQALDDVPDMSEHNLRKIDLLNAVIYETLRLYAPVAAGSQRITPKEGIHIGENYIPGNVLVQIPIYSIHRDKRSFEWPEEFLPERWTTKPELVKNRLLFIPFQTGEMRPPSTLYPYRLLTSFKGRMRAMEDNLP
ncbi:hypothetical protein AtubIFM61612_010442 [Aspergillus tubingensis]|nr:hypothetical protein AtubIFM61612_010442 [Aspergillus tubingensis]